ncbi:uncharacterized protein LOC135810321 [Sycon ciliatum]|uniref:uncharacterized protein LOC135810321 n=1 Tax=Sycon ciliatum TaxID=27933 RepID=UPI0031F602BC
MAENSATNGNLFLDVGKDFKSTDQVELLATRLLGNDDKVTRLQSENITDPSRVARKIMGVWEESSREGIHLQYLYDILCDIGMAHTAIKFSSRLGVSIDKHRQHGQAAPTRTTSATTGQSRTESQQGRGAKTAETVSDGRRQQSSDGAGLNTCFCADPFKDPRYVSAVDLFLKSLDPTELRNRAQQAGDLLNESQVDRLVWTEQHQQPHIHNHELIKVIKPQEQLGYISLCRIIKDWGKYPGKLAEMNQLLPADKRV